MKKIISIYAILSLAILLAGCTSGKFVSNGEKYTMNASVAYGAAEDNHLDKTKVTYQIYIGGSKEDVENIVSHEVIINEDYADLLLENGPPNAQVKYEDQSYLEISGSFVFDTRGKSKEEINAMNLLKGVSIVDKDKNAYMLEFNNSKH